MFEQLNRYQCKEFRRNRRRRCQCQLRRSQEIWRPCRKNPESFCIHCPCPTRLLLCKAFALQICSSLRRMTSCPRIWISEIVPNKALLSQWAKLSSSRDGQKFTWSQSISNHWRFASNTSLVLLHMGALSPLQRRGSRRERDRAQRTSSPPRSRGSFCESYWGREERRWNRFDWSRCQKTPRQFPETKHILIRILHIPQTFDRIPNCFSMVDRTAER